MLYYTRFFPRPTTNTNGDMYLTGANERISPEKRLDFVVNSSDSSVSNATPSGGHMSAAGHNYSNFNPPLSSLDYSVNGSYTSSEHHDQAALDNSFNTMHMVRPIPTVAAGPATSQQQQQQLSPEHQQQQLPSKIRTMADLHHSFPSSDEDIHHALPVYLPTSDSNCSSSGIDDGGKDGLNSAALQSAPTVPARPQKSPYFPPIVNQFPGRSIKPMRKYNRINEKYHMTKKFYCF